MIWSTFGRRLVALPGISSIYSLLVAAGLIREKLTANRTYYVRTDGSDSNTGLVDSAGGAFLTKQKAIDVTAALDQAGFTVVIQVGAGTYTAGMAMKQFTGPVFIQGDTTTPSNVVISTTSALPVTHIVVAVVTIQGFKLTSSAASALIYCAGTGSAMSLGVMEYGTVTGQQIWIDNGAAVTMFGNYTISGGAVRHLYINANATYTVSSITVTLTGTPAFSTNFVTALSGAVATAFSVTYSGSATGARYSASTNGVINTFGGGASYFPGNSAGSTATGGQYA